MVDQDRGGDATVIPVIVVNGDLALKIRSLRVDLKSCNADKAAIREWYRVYSR